MANQVSAQGTVGIVALQTGAGTPLVSEILPLPAAVLGNILQFEFGFATDEVFGPGRIFDSFTVSMQREGAAEIQILATLDPSGAVFAPPGGGILTDPSAIVRASIPFPSLSPVLSMRTAYIVSTSIPPELLGGPLQVFFDLFDNQDQVRSLAYFRNVTVVPEPGGWVLIPSGLMALLCLRRFSRKSWK